MSTASVSAPTARRWRSGSDDGIIKFWNLETGENTRTLNKGQNECCQQPQFEPRRPDGGFGQ